MKTLSGSGIGATAWRVAGGSVPGADHRRVDRPNQDAVHWGRVADAVVAVVADGCGSGAHSEVGARLGALLWVRAALELVSGGADPRAQATWDAVASSVLAGLEPLVSRMDGARRQLVREQLLFTLVSAVVTERWAVVVAIGDGLVALDGEVTRLGPFPDNRPPYLGYGLLADHETPRPRLLHVRPTADLSTVVLGTDGLGDLLDRAALPVPGTLELVGGLDQLVAPAMFRHPDALRRRLARINRTHVAVDWEQERVDRTLGVLPDDTSVVVMRREVSQ